MSVRGLERFRAYFRPHADDYMLIGGTACAVLFDHLGVGFRSTRDFDVLVVADGDRAFLQTLSAFIRDGAYQRHIDARGRQRCFRFTDPSDASWPSKLEVCARRSITDHEARQYFPLVRPADGADLVSLSAILFDDAYVQWLAGGADVVDGVRVARLEYLLPLKALAWKNLSAARERGEAVDGDDIRKHKLDCFRLINRIPPALHVTLPDIIAADVAAFIAAMEAEMPGLPPDLSAAPPIYLRAMRMLYGLTPS